MTTTCVKSIETSTVKLLQEKYFCDTCQSFEKKNSSWMVRQEKNIGRDPDDG
jgi:hypothetical protein